MVAQFAKDKPKNTKALSAHSPLPSNTFLIAWNGVTICSSVSKSAPQLGILSSGNNWI